MLIALSIAAWACTLLAMGSQVVMPCKMQYSSILCNKLSVMGTPSLTIIRNACTELQYLVSVLETCVAGTGCQVNVL